MTALFSGEPVHRALSRLSIAHPAATLASWILVGAACAYLALDLGVDTSTGSILNRAAPEWSRYEASVREFGSDEVLVVGIDAALVDHASVLEIDEHLGKIAGVSRVESLASLSVPAEVGGDLRFAPPTFGHSLEEAIALALSSDLAKNSVVSKDGSLVAWIVFPESNYQSYDRLVASVLRAAPSGAWVSGVPVYRSESNKVTRSELRRLMPVSLAALLVVGWLVLGRLRLAVVALLPGVLATLVVAALMVMAGTSVTFMTMVLPPILLALGVAYAIHPIVASAGEGASFGHLIQKADGVALSGLTTVIGLLSAALVPIPAVRELGGFGAAGVMVATFCAISLVPSLAWAFDARRPLRRIGAVGPSLLVIPQWCGVHPRSVVVLWLLLFGVGLVGLRVGTVDTDATRWFGSNTRINIDYQAISRGLSGISPINVVVERVDGRSMVGRADRDQLAAFVRYLRDRSEVGYAVSIAELLAELRIAFSSGPGEAGVEQLLLVAEGEPQLRYLLTPDYARANVPMRVRDNSSAALLALADDAEGWWADLSDYDATATGIMFEFARAEDAIAWGQSASLLVASVVVGLVLLWALGPGVLCAVALLTNLCPVVLVAGLMGLGRIPLDAATVVLGALAIGIGVDDTLHLSLAYVRNRRGSSRSSAVQAAYLEVAPAITSSTVVVAVGFSVLATSEFLLVSQLGLLTLVAAIVCWLADLTLLAAGLNLGRAQDA